MVEAFVLTNADSDDLAELKKELMILDHIKSVHIITGPYDLIVTVEVADMRELADVVMGEMRSISGVRETLTCVSVG